MLIVCLADDPVNKDRQYWDFLLSNFRVDKLFVIGEKKGETSSIFKNAVYIDSANNLPTDIPLVVFAPLHGRYIQGNICIYDFKPPHDAIYLFGSDYSHLNNNHLSNRSPDHIVYIPTDSNVEMYSCIAAGIAFYDRIIKWQIR